MQANKGAQKYITMTYIYPNSEAKKSSTNLPAPSFVASIDNILLPSPIVTRAAKTSCPNIVVAHNQNSDKILQPVQSAPHKEICAKNSIQLIFLCIESVLMISCVMVLFPSFVLPFFILVKTDNLVFLLTSQPSLFF